MKSAFASASPFRWFLLLFLLLWPAAAFAAPPVLDLDPADAGGLRPDVSIRFTEGDGPIRIAPAAAVTIPDGREPDALTLALVPAAPGDLLTADPGDTGIAVDWDGETLRLLGPAPAAAFQRVLRTVSFEAPGRNPDPRARTIVATAEAGAETSEPVHASVEIWTINDPPELDLDPEAEGRGRVFALPEGPAATLVAPNAALSDPDDEMLAGATIALVNGAAGDRLTAEVGGSGVRAETVGNVLRLSGEAPVPVYRDILRSLRLHVAAGGPDRVIAAAVSDGARNSRVSLAIAARDPNDPPEVVVATFTEKGPPVAVAGPGASLTAPSGRGFDALTATLENPRPGDRLRAETADTAIVAEYAGGVLRLSGNDDDAAYTAALRSIVFFNASDHPDPDFRIIRFRARSGDMETPEATTVLSVIPVNDPPELTLPGPRNTPRDVPLIFSTVEGNAIVLGDPDAGDGILEVRLFVPRGTLSASPGNGAELIGAGTGDFRIVGTLADINAALDGLRYDPEPGWSGTTRLTVTADDRGHTGAPGPAYDQGTISISVAVTTGPEPPVADAGPDRRADAGTRVELDGRGSYARTGTLVAFSWTRIAGPTTTLSGAETATPFFVAPSVAADTALRFRLTVRDSQNGSDSDEATVVVVPVDPPGPGEPDWRVEEGGTGVLGIGDAGHGATGYLWEQLSGPPAPLSDSGSPTPTFVAPATGPAGARLEFRATVFRADEEPTTHAVSVAVSDNGIAGFPEDVLTYRAHSGTAMGIRVSGGDLVRLVGTDPAAIADRRGRPLGFPFGLTELEIRVPGPGRRARIDFFLPAPADPKDRWFKHDPAVGWYDFGGEFSADRRRVSIEIGDGSRGDIDGVANGRIVDPSGLATPSGLPPAPGQDGDGDGDGDSGGCFLDSVGG